MSTISIRISNFTYLVCLRRGSWCGSSGNGNILSRYDGITEAVRAAPERLNIRASVDIVASTTSRILDGADRDIAPAVLKDGHAVRTRS